MRKLIVASVCLALFVGLPATAAAQRDPFRPGIQEGGQVDPGVVSDPSGTTAEPSSGSGGTLPRSGVDASDHLILAALFIAVGIAIDRLSRWARFA